MKKVIRLTESDLERIVKKVINEQDRKFFEQEYGNVIFSKSFSYPEEEGPVDTEPYKMPEYFKPYIGLTVSEYDFNPKTVLAGLVGGQGNIELKIGDLTPAYEEKAKPYDPEKYGFDGIMATIKVAIEAPKRERYSEFFYYSCAEKQWKYISGGSDLRDQKLFNRKFFELGNFIQSKFCSSERVKKRVYHPR